MRHPNEIEKYRKEYESYSREQLIAVLRSYYSDDSRYIAANNLLQDLRESEANEHNQKSMKLSKTSVLWAKIAGMSAIAACIIQLVSVYVLPPDKTDKNSTIQEQSQQQKATKPETHEKNSLNTSALQKTQSSATQRKPH